MFVFVLLAWSSRIDMNNVVIAFCSVIVFFSSFDRNTFVSWMRYTLMPTTLLWIEWNRLSVPDTSYIGLGPVLFLRFQEIENNFIAFVFRWARLSFVIVVSSVATRRPSALICADVVPNIFGENRLKSHSMSKIYSRGFLISILAQLFHLLRVVSGWFILF